MLHIQNEWLLVSYEEASRQLIIEDRRIGKTWKQAPFPREHTPEAAIEGENSLRFSFASPIPMTMTVSLEPAAELTYTLHAGADQPTEDLAFPPAILPPNREHYILQTDSDGLLLPVDGCGYPLEQQPIFRCSGGPCMAWMGMTDYALEAGYMAIFETPYDADVLLKKENGLIDFGVVWKSSLGKFAYDRKLRLVFFDQGGYVAQCKRYRPYGWEKNGVRSLLEKAERFPKAEKAFGAVQIHLWEEGRTAEFLEELKESGIEKAMVIWNSNHLPYPDRAFDEAAVRLGYALSRYELFTDTQPDTPWRMERYQKIPLLLSYYPGQLDNITLMDKDGGKYVNQFGTIVCPVGVREVMDQRLQKALKDHSQETYFVDVYLANGSFECYDPRHPLTREGYVDAMMENLRYIEDRYGAYVGSEFGAEYGLSTCLYVQGMTTLQRTWWEDPRPTAPGSIYYIGDWRNNSCPSIVVGTRTATDTYLKYGINEYTRVPLYELVYHDAVMATWRWEDCNHHYPEIWWKKDLLNILYGSTPIWSFDREHFRKYKTTFQESYKKVMPWLGQIVTDELVCHRFITEDHKVQRSDFSSGKSVVVNFGNSDYLYEGKTVPARGYVILEEEI